VISLKSGHLAVIVPVVFAAGIGLTMAFNVWKTETTKVPAAYTSGEFAGSANPADIRGSYTFADIAAAFPVPVEALARAFGVVENQAAFQVKSLEGAFEGLPEGVEIGTDSVRLFVARYAGLPFEPEEGTALPAEAVGILAARPGGLGAEQVADLQARSVGGEPATTDAVAAAVTTPATTPPTTATVATAATAPAAASPAALTTGTGATGAADTADHAATTEDRTIKGKTTFRDLLDWGVSEADVKAVFGGGMGATGVAVRDYCTEKGIEFSTVKTTLQALVDAAAP
jgi:hypothetical protein